LQGGTTKQAIMMKFALIQPEGLEDTLSFNSNPTITIGGHKIISGNFSTDTQPIHHRTLSTAISTVVLAKNWNDKPPAG
jgi:hypothetical protein